VLVNGSEAGAWIETNEPLPLLTRLRIEIEGGELEAQVIRVHWLNAEERLHGHGGMAVRVLAYSMRKRSESPLRRAATL
jgi:hypothetical protein